VHDRGQQVSGKGTRKGSGDRHRRGANDTDAHTYERALLVAAHGHDRAGDVTEPDVDDEHVGSARGDKLATLTVGR
jgi:hypothetical protein